jgi:hypothetical protein
MISIILHGGTIAIPLGLYLMVTFHFIQTAVEINIGGPGFAASQITKKLLVTLCIWTGECHSDVCVFEISFVPYQGIVYQPRGVLSRHLSPL